MPFVGARVVRFRGLWARCSLKSYNQQWRKPMKTKSWVSYILMFNLMMSGFGCKTTRTEEVDIYHNPFEHNVAYSYAEPPDAGPLPPSEPTDVGGLDGKFKIPVPKGYDWEVTQSWGEHCQKCIDKGYTDWKYCTDPVNLAHVKDCCKYGWDFSLPGEKDKELPVLASGAGILKKIGDDGETGWGLYVIVDHGNDVCSLYAHMLEGSTSHLKEKQPVCQGLIIGSVGATGNAKGYHLHYQHQKCSTGEPLKMGFTDGNGVPECTRNKDVYGPDGKYNFLKLTNDAVKDCSEAGIPTPPLGGWNSSKCGPLGDCPLNKECNMPSGHKFTDHYKLDTKTADAAAYLYSECAIEGYANNMLLPNNFISRAEALKVAMYMFNLMGKCGDNNTYKDVDYNKWYYPIVACAIKKGVLSNWGGYFSGDEPASFEDIATYLVRAATLAGVTKITISDKSHFKYIPIGHSASIYAETVFSHGGSDTSYYYFQPDMKLKRGDFITMAASLSPCYCKNVSCEDGCSCNQEKYSCVVNASNPPGGAGAGVGGVDAGSSDGGAYAGSDAGTGGGSVAGPKYVIDCFIDEKKPVLCNGDNNVFRVACHLENKTNTALQFKKLDLAITQDNGGKCVVIDPDLNGDSVQTVAGKVYKKLAGDYSIACLDPPNNGEIEVSFDYMMEVDGAVVWKKKFLSTAIEVTSKDFKQCKPVGCITQCKGKTCGSDGCGGVCGQCMPGKEVCVEGVCKKPICTPSCEGKECGWDGCEGTCAKCPEGFWCSSYKCLKIPCSPKCYQKMCGTDGCGGVCGTCNSDQHCVEGQCKKKDPGAPCPPG